MLGQLIKDLKVISMQANNIPIDDLTAEAFE
jgi:hypothetical protein